MPTLPLPLLRDKALGWQMMSVVVLSLACTDADPATSPTDVATPRAAVVASADGLHDIVSQPFGSFGDLTYTRHTGRFSGVSDLGPFDMPFEVIAPTDPGLSDGSLLVEPPHFAFGPAGREQTLGRDLVFAEGMSYAAVGFGTHGLNVLDPTATDLVLAGEPLASPGSLDPTPVVDEEILIQFVTALTDTEPGQSMVGAVERRYAYGISQTAAVLLETLHHPDGGLFDFTLLHLALWNPPFEASTTFERLPSEFAPLDDVGRVAFVESEGDLLVSDATQFRQAVPRPDYRVYEVAGAAHIPSPLNPLDHGLIARAIFVGGRAWVEGGAPLATSRVLALAPPGLNDPVYGFETGIARDADLNAVGGVRLPEVEIGTAQFIAANFAIDAAPPLGLFGLLGGMVDLTCAPRAGGEEIRFPSHGAFVAPYVHQANALAADGLLLAEDAQRMKEGAAEAAVGRRGGCES